MAVNLKSFKFEELPPTYQVVVVGIVLVALSAVFYTYYLSPIKLDIARLDAEIQNLDIQVKKGQAVERKLPEFKSEIERLRLRLESLRKILPEAKETPDLVRKLQNFAELSSLKIKKFTPQPTVAHDFYLDWPIQMEVEGSYPNLGAFFEKVGNYVRIINVSSISISAIANSADANRTLTATCTATTFILMEEKPLTSGPGTAPAAAAAARVGQ